MIDFERFNTNVIDGGMMGHGARGARCRVTARWAGK